MSNLLNDMQSKAVNNTEGPLLILAGAGSGKTRVLVYRIAKLIDNGVKPYNILAITFTNKASKEMRERVIKLIGNDGLDVFMSTFHSFCVRILRRECERIEFKKSFNIYDADDSEKVIKECLRELNINEKQFAPKIVLATIGKCKDELISPFMFEQEAKGDYYKETVSKVYNMYQAKLKRYNAFDFDDLIFMTVKLFRECPDVLSYYQNRFKYIMVDEYQDTNYSQYQLVKLLSEKHKNICVVGDDDQSIYSWRGADIRNILEFEQDFKGAAVIKLEQNYRSTSNILNGANNVIKNNLKRKSKSLWTSKDVGELVSIFENVNEREESHVIVGEIKKLHNEGIAYNDIAVLYRTNMQSRSLEDQLVMQNIPYRIYGGVRFYDRKEIKDILAYLKILVNPYDDLSLKRIINVPKRSIGDTTVSRIEAFASTYDRSFLQAIEHIDEIKTVRKPDVIAAFYSLISGLTKLQETASVVQVIEAVITQTGYISELEKEGTEDAKNRIDNIKELINKGAEFDLKNDTGLTGFLEEVALVADIDSYSTSADVVTLMTVHSAKGLEFPYVFIAGIEEGLFPSYNSIAFGDLDAIEEERRLFYVAVTRAMEKLYLAYARQRMQRGNIVYNNISRFIKELPSEVLDTVKTVVREGIHEEPPKSNRPMYGKGAIYKSKPIISKATQNVHLSYKKGDMVKHLKYGVGKVLSICPAGKDFEIEIEFPIGTKKVMAGLSKLIKID